MPVTVIASKYTDLPVFSWIQNTKLLAFFLIILKNRKIILYVISIIMDHFEKKKKNMQNTVYWKVGEQHGGTGLWWLSPSIQRLASKSCVSAFGIFHCIIELALILLFQPSLAVSKWKLIFHRSLLYMFRHIIFYLSSPVLGTFLNLILCQNWMPWIML